MKSIVLDDEGWIYTGVKSKFQYFSVHNVFHLSPRRQKKSNVFQVFLRKGPIYSLLGGGGGGGGGWGEGVAEFWSFFSSLFLPLSY